MITNDHDQKDLYSRVNRTIKINTVTMVMNKELQCTKELTVSYNNTYYST